MKKTRHSIVVSPITKNKPLPVGRPGRMKSILGRMDKGDSFGVTGRGQNPNLKLIARSIRAACHVFGKGRKIKFIVRVFDEEIRIWRIK